MNEIFRAGRRPAFLSALSLSLLLVSAVPGQAVEFDEWVAFCTACHGEDGRPNEPDIPVLWGQEFYYLYVQLKDYKADRRANEVMSEIAADLGKAEIFWSSGPGAAVSPSHPVREIRPRMRTHKERTRMNSSHNGVIAANISHTPHRQTSGWNWLIYSVSCQSHTQEELRAGAAIPVSPPSNVPCLG